jgi:hypothetical protein
VETIAAAFTDHLVVVLRLAIEKPIPSAGKSYWRMNVSYLHDKTFREDFTTRWEQWKKHKKFYRNSVLWWGRYVKRMVRQLFTSEGTNRRRDRQSLENFYYDAIYNILQDATLTDTTYVRLKKLKAKIVRLHREPTQRLFLHTEDQDKCEDETPSLYYILQMRKRQESRMIDSVYDSEAHLQTSPLAMLRVYTELMKNKYDKITVNADSIHRILRHSSSKMPLIANEALDSLNTMEELHIAVKEVKNLKALGYDGICHDFFQLAWETIKDDLLDVMNQMFVEESILDTQNMELLYVCQKQRSLSKRRITDRSLS